MLVYRGGLNVFIFTFLSDFYIDFLYYICFFLWDLSFGINFIYLNNYIFII